MIFRKSVTQGERDAGFAEVALVIFLGGGDGHHQIDVGTAVGGRSELTKCYLPHLETNVEAFESLSIPPSLCADMYKKLRFKSIV